MKTSNCVVCNKELKLVDYGETFEQPYGGVVFYGYGHYGSCVYDPFVKSKIFMSICDECIIEKIKSGHIKGDIQDVSENIPEVMKTDPDNGAF